MSTQTLQPLICLARRWTRSIVREGTPPLSERGRRTSCGQTLEQSERSSIACRLTAPRNETGKAERRWTTAGTVTLDSRWAGCQHGGCPCARFEKSYV